MLIFDPDNSSVSGSYWIHGHYSVFINCINKHWCFSLGLQTRTRNSNSHLTISQASTTPNDSGFWGRWLDGPSVVANCRFSLLHLCTLNYGVLRYRLCKLLVYTWKIVPGTEYGVDQGINQCVYLSQRITQTLDGILLLHKRLKHVLRTPYKEQETWYIISQMTIYLSF